MSEPRNYHEIRPYSDSEVRDAIRRNDADELRTVIIALALHHLDGKYVENLCYEFGVSPNEVLRGNAILALGHLARRFGELETRAARLVEGGLSDPSEYVRGQAWAAADDVTHFLGWSIAGFNEGD